MSTSLCPPKASWRHLRKFALREFAFFLAHSSKNNRILKSILQLPKTVLVRPCTKGTVIHQLVFLGSSTNDLKIAFFFLRGFKFVVIFRERVRNATFPRAESWRCLFCSFRSIFGRIRLPASDPLGFYSTRHWPFPGISETKSRFSPL